METNDRLVWFALSATSGLGPVKLQQIANVLDSQRESVVSLVGLDAAELIERVKPMKLSDSLAHAIQSQLEGPLRLPEVADGVRLAIFGDEEFPNERFLQSRVPCAPVLWLGGATSLASFRGPTLGVSGSRNAPEEILEVVAALARSASRQSWLVVSGLAVGVDSAAHQGAIYGGTGTVGVMASGILSQSNSWRPEDPESICFVSQFAPSDPWSGPRAMQRNATIATFSDRVLVAASGVSGGTWNMAELCLKNEVPLFVFDLPEDVAEGNQKLIGRGAIPVDIENPESCLESIEE